MYIKLKFTFCFIFLIFFYCSGNEKFPALKGDYLGQKPPGDIPELFAPGIISTDQNELNSVFSPDGKEFYYSIYEPGTEYKIMVTRLTNKLWTKPQLASFSNESDNADLCISSDGKKIFFCSRRPLKKGDPNTERFHIWYVEKEKGKWGEPENLGSIINPGFYPTITDNQTIYFVSKHEVNNGGTDIYRSKNVNGKFLKPENIGEPVNSKYDEGDALIAPDESYLIFCAVGYPDSFGGGDLYISFKKVDGTWTKVKNLGEKINTESTEYSPMLSYNRKYLFFTRKKNENGDIYWVDAKIIEDLKPEELQ